MVDLQALYPKAWVEGTSIQALVKWYISLSRDPILGGALGSSKAWDWLRTFFVLECTFQAPCFVIGAWGLWNSESASCCRSSSKLTIQMINASTVCNLVFPADSSSSRGVRRVHGNYSTSRPQRRAH